jgi:hypothetical protein
MVNRVPRNIKLLEQVPDSNPFKKTVAPAFDLVDFLEKDLEAVRLDRRLSDEGKKEKVQGHLRKALRELRDLQKPIEEFHSATEAMREKVKRPAFDKTDYVAALNRKELRDAARAMTFGQRAMRMTGPTRSKAFIDAVLEFEDDPWMSGINTDDPGEREIFEAAKESRLRDFHAQLLDQIAARDATESEARMIPAVVRNDIAADYSGLERKDFEELAKIVESRIGAPWILKDKKTVCEVVNGKAEYHLASPDELRDGVEYPNEAAYLSARAA